MSLPPCDYRADMPAEGVFYCLHSKVHVADNLVRPKHCLKCGLRETVAEPREPPAIYPGLVQKAQNLAKAVGDHVRGGRRILSEDAQQARWSVCRACEYFDGQRCQHEKCGCTAFARKLSWESSECPLGKWDSLNGSDH